MKEARLWLASQEELAQKHPYYAAVLARLEVLPDPSVRRMAVAADDKHLYLFVNVAEMGEHPEFALGLLMHQVHHVVLGHLTHPRFRDPAHPELLRLAMEISANEHVPYPLPERSPRWEDFTEQGLRRGQSTLHRYELLCSSMRRGELSRNGHAPADEHAPRAAPGLDHAPRDRDTHERVRNAVEHAVRSVRIRPLGEGGLLAGREPGAILEELAPDEGPPRVFIDYRRALRLFATAARAPQHTYARPSRRFPERVGEVPGRAWFPARGPRPRIGCAIDTSASMLVRELEEIARQLRAIAAFVDVTVIECDASIQRIYAFDRELRSVRGRGGTDLRPPFDRETLERYAPDGLVYFTDGRGPFPRRPPRVPVLWVLTKPASFPCPWGTKATFLSAEGAI